MNNYVLGIIIALIAFAGGYAAAGGEFGAGERHDKLADEKIEGGHAHDTLLEVPDGAVAPSVSLEVLEDPMTGWNARLSTANFTFAPEHVSQENVFGEGHAHIYVNGKKINRVYGEWYHLGELPVGEHEITVGLYSNDHSAYAVDGEKIADTVMLTVEPEPEVNRATAQVFDLAVAERSLTPQTVVVTQGESVILNISTDEAGEFHLTGYEIEREMDTEDSVEVAFIADKAGRYSFELHPMMEGSDDEHGATEDIVIGTFVVEPK